MAVIKLGQMLHKGSVGPVTAANPLDTEDINGAAILAALGLVSKETTLLDVKAAAESLDGTLATVLALLSDAIVDV